MPNYGSYTVHPVADLFPLLPENELKELADDIMHQGQQEPITITHDHSTLVDGRNRYLACDLLNEEPIFTTLPEYYGDADIRDYILSANLRRRHLNPGQLAVVALGLEPYYAEEAKERQRQAGREHGGAEWKTGSTSEKQLPPDLAEANDRNSRESRARAAHAIGASRSGVGQAKALSRDAPDLLDRVRDGSMALDAADRERRARNAKLPPKPPKPKPNPTFLTLSTHTGEEIAYPLPTGKAVFNETPGEGISWAAWSWNPVTGCDQAPRDVGLPSLSASPLSAANHRDTVR